MTTKDSVHVMSTISNSYIIYIIYMMGGSKIIHLTVVCNAGLLPESSCCVCDTICQPEIGSDENISPPIVEEEEEDMSSSVLRFSPLHLNRENEQTLTRC